MSQPASTAFSSQGTVIEVKITGTYQPIYECYGLQNAAGETPEIDITTLGSTIEEVLLDFPKSDQWDWEMNHLPADATHQYLEALKNSGAANDFRITASDTGGETREFSARVKKFAVNFQTRQASKVAVSIKQTGATTVTP